MTVTHTAPAGCSSAAEHLLPSKMKIPLFLYAFVLFCFSVLLTGYRVYHGNHAIQLPLVDLINNSSLYPNDPFAATLRYYASTLWYLVAWGTRVVDLETLLLLLFLLERLFVIWAAGHLARTVAPGSGLAAVGAMAMFALAPTPVVGNGTIVAPYFEQTGLAIPFFLMAMASFYRTSRIAWAIWLAIGFNLNSMYGTYAVTYFAVVFLLDSSYRKAWKEWALAFVFFVLLSSPALVLTLSAFKRQVPDAGLWLKASQARFWHHLNPLTWRKLEFVEFAVLVFVFAGSFYQNRDRLEKLFKHGMAWTLVGVAWLVYAFMAAYMFKSPAMLVMHPARGTDLWYCFAGIGVLSIYAMNLESAKEAKALIAAAFFACIFVWQPIVHSSLPFLLMMILIVFAWEPVRRYVCPEGNPNRIALLATAGVLVVAAWSFQTRRNSKDPFEAPFVGRPDAAMTEVAEWARTNAPVDAVFVIDPTWSEFRALSKRPVFVTWQDGSAMLWDRPFVTEWVERLRLIGVDNLVPRLQADMLSDRYAKLSDGDLRKLKSKYPVRYWVVLVDHPSVFPIAFQTKRFKVLEVN